MPKIAMCSSSMIMADWLDALKAAARNDYADDVGFLKNFEHVITLEVIDVGMDPEPALRCRRAVRELLS